MQPYHSLKMVGRNFPHCRALGLVQTALWALSVALYTSCKEEQGHGAARIVMTMVAGVLTLVQQIIPFRGECHPDCGSIHPHAKRHDTCFFELTVDLKARVLDCTRERNLNPLFVDTWSHQHHEPEPSLSMAQLLQTRRTKNMPVITVTYPGQGGWRRGSFLTSTARRLACPRQALKIAHTWWDHPHLLSTKKPSRSLCPVAACHGTMSTSKVSPPALVLSMMSSQNVQNMRWDRKGSQVRQAVCWSGRNYIPCLSLLATSMLLLIHVFLTAVLCLQWQIIGHIDDVKKLAIKWIGQKISGRRESHLLRFCLVQCIPLSVLF